MMVILCFVLLFFNPSNAELSNKTLETKSPSCEVNVTCPAIVAPLCLRVMKKNQTDPVKKSIHIVVVNKCEMQYLKCHQDVEAAVVPIKNCESGHKQLPIPIGLSKKRVKRQVEDPNIRLTGLTSVKGMPMVGNSSQLTLNNTSGRRFFWGLAIRAAILVAKQVVQLTAKTQAKNIAQKKANEIKKKVVKKVKKEAKKKAKKKAEEETEEEDIIGENVSDLAEEIEERANRMEVLAQQIEERAQRIVEVRDAMKLKSVIAKYKKNVNGKVLQRSGKTTGKKYKDNKNKLYKVNKKKTLKLTRLRGKPFKPTLKPKPTKAKPTKSTKPTKPMKPTIPERTKPKLKPRVRRSILNRGFVEEYEENKQSKVKLNQDEYNVSELKKKRRVPARTTKRKPKPTRPKPTKPKQTKPKPTKPKPTTPKPSKPKTQPKATTDKRGQTIDINISGDMNIIIKSSGEDRKSLEEIGEGKNSKKTTIPNDEEPTDVPNSGDEDTTDVPADDDEDITVPDLPSDPSEPDDNNSTITDGSDFDAQMKKFDAEMSKFHDEFHKQFPNVDKGKKKKLITSQLSPEKAAAKLEAFQKDIASFEKDIKNLEIKLDTKKPIVHNTDEIDQENDAEEESPNVIEEDENDEKDDDEDADETAENQNSPEDPEFVMPPPGGKVKKLTDDKKEDDESDVEYAVNDGEEEDVEVDENLDDKGVDKIVDGGDGDNINENSEKDINVSENDKEDELLPKLTLGDWQEYTGECPNECPSRDVMLCARCRHDIYRTFLSSCHLRKFACEQPEEKLQLVSWSPCAASAPFLTDLSESVKRLSEANDDDAVLRFVYCRMKGLNGGRSPPAFKGTNAKCDIAA